MLGKFVPSNKVCSNKEIRKPGGHCMTTNKCLITSTILLKVEGKEHYHLHLCAVGEHLLRRETISLFLLQNAVCIIYTVCISLAALFCERPAAPISLSCRVVHRSSKSSISKHRFAKSSLSRLSKVAGRN